jgi:hypothetical protein
LDHTGLRFLQPPPGSRAVEAHQVVDAKRFNWDPDDKRDSAFCKSPVKAGALKPKPD